MAEVSKYELPETVRARIRQLYAVMGLQSRPCKKCRRIIWWVPTAKGKLAPFTDDGVTHFVDCPAAKGFRREKEDES